MKNPLHCGLNGFIQIFSNQTKQYTNWKKNETKQPILISKAPWMNFGQREDSGIVEKHPNQLWLKY